MIFSRVQSKAVHAEGKEEAAEKNLLAERRSSYAECEHEPRGLGRVQHLLNRRVARQMQHRLKCQGHSGATHAQSKETPAKTDRGCAAPLKALQYSPAPKQGKYRCSREKRNQIQEAHDADVVEHAFLHLVGGGHPEEMKVHRNQGEYYRTDRPGQQQQQKQENVSEMRNADRAWGLRCDWGKDCPLEPW